LLSKQVRPKIGDEPESVPRTVTKLNEADISFEKVQGRSYLGIKFNQTPILGWFLYVGSLPLSECFKESRLG